MSLDLGTWRHEASLRATIDLRYCRSCFVADHDSVAPQALASPRLLGTTRMAQAAESLSAGMAMVLMGPFGSASCPIGLVCVFHRGAKALALNNDYCRPWGTEERCRRRASRTVIVEIAEGGKGHVHIFSAD
eukprot:scaffold4278_cov346-Prasinococcus_capsulatus_cf.AAC.4